MIRGVFFDLDDTLIAYREFQRTALMAAWTETFGARAEVEPEALRLRFRSVYHARFDYGTPGYAELARIDGTEIARCVAAEALTAFGLQEPSAVECFVQAWVQGEQSALALFPDTVATLSTLRGAGMKLGVITNGPSATQRYKLEHLALAEAFDAIVIDTEFGHPKPDRRIFEHAAGAVNLPPAELLFAGDSLSADVAGSRAAGWTAVWCNPDDAALPADAEPPHHTIRTLAELLTLPPLAHLARARRGDPS